MSKRIDDTVCHCLKMRRSAENVIRFYDAILAPSQVTVRQYSLLKAVRENRGCSLRVLSEATLLDRSTLTRSLKPLLQSGYLSDQKAVGARDCVLDLTREGERICEEAGKLWEKAQKEFERKLSADQLKQLEETLLLLQDL